MGCAKLTRWLQLFFSNILWAVRRGNSAPPQKLRSTSEFKLDSRDALCEDSLLFLYLVVIQGGLVVDSRKNVIYFKILLVQA